MVLVSTDLFLGFLPLLLYYYLRKALIPFMPSTHARMIIYYNLTKLEKIDHPCIFIIGERIGYMISNKIFILFLNQLQLLVSVKNEPY